MGNWSHRLDFTSQRLVYKVVAVAFGLLGSRAVGPVRAVKLWRHGVFDVLAVLAGAGLIAFGFVLLRRKRLFENVPTSRIRSVAMGFAEVAGQARSKATVTAPWSGIPCVYFRFKVEVETSRGRRGRTWQTIEQGDSAIPFYLQDATGTILVDPAGAETVLQQSFRKIERGEGWFAKRKRCTEWWIVPAQKVFVAGTVSRVRDLAHERRMTLHDRLRELKADPERLSQFDINRDGRISTEEWGNAVRAVQEEVVREAAAAPATLAEDDIVIGQGIGERTFLIADRSEKSLLGRLALQSGAAIAGGAALLLVFGVSILGRVGVLPDGWAIGW